MATDPTVNWRDTALQTDQEIVECLSQTLGRAVGYGENALGGYDPSGNSKLTVITTSSATSVEQQIIDAISANGFNWIVFDKNEFSSEYEIGLYRVYCSNAAVQTALGGASEADCIDYQQWCANNSVVGEAACLEEFFNNRLNNGALPIRNPVISSNKTIDGRLSNAYFRFSGFSIGSTSVVSSNVILANLDFRGAGHLEDHQLDPDMIRSTGTSSSTFGMASHDIWIHKNSFDLTGDSAFDVKMGAHSITMSFNRLVNVKRASLHGSNDSRTVNSQISTTMHHNAFITEDDFYMVFGNIGRRVPLVRRGTSHMFNNVFMNYRKDTLSVRLGANVLWEDNAFIINQVHQEKATVEASLDELQGQLARDFRDTSNFRADDVFLWFSDSDCNIDATTQRQITNSLGSIGDLSQNYTQASRDVIGAQQISAGQDLVDYVAATAGVNGELPFNSPLAGDQSYVLSLGKVSCQSGNP